MVLIIGQIYVEEVKGIGNKSVYIYMGLYFIMKLLYSKGNK